jgi:hypothetical protein
MKRLTLAVVVALAGVATFAAISLGGESSSRSPTFDRSFERVPVHPSDVPASRSALGQVSAKGKPKIKYFESSAQPVPAAGADFILACPSKHKAVTGYFLTTGAITPDISAISEDSSRRWEFGFVNLAGSAGEAIVGVVCGKKL